MDIANDKRTRYCNRLNSNGISVGIIAIRGIKQTSHLDLAVKIIDSIKFGNNFFTVNLVPLHSFGELIFRNNIIKEPTFRFKQCGGVPAGSSNLFVDQSLIY